MTTIKHGGQKSFSQDLMEIMAGAKVDAHYKAVRALGVAKAELAAAGLTGLEISRLRYKAMDTPLMVQLTQTNLMAYYAKLRGLGAAKADDIRDMSDAELTGLGMTAPEVERLRAACATNAICIPDWGDACSEQGQAQEQTTQAAQNSGVAIALAVLGTTLMWCLIFAAFNSVSLPSFLSSPPPPSPPAPPPPSVVWPEIYRFTGTVQDTYLHKAIPGDFKKTKVISNGAYVYESVNRKAFYYTRGYPVFLYLYRDPETGELLWIFGLTYDNKPEEVNDPRYSASKGHYGAFFDSSASAKGACALNGPASPGCKWRECKGSYCYPYPSKDSWYGASASLKVVVGGKGGH